MKLTVNGAARDFTAPARTHLADLLRDQLGLTGTHLGCEQGVCGACTVLLDGAPVRACLLYAHEAAGHAVTTIEGLDGDATAAALRAAFTRHHALQCGYCTPGMMMTARDIVLRLGSVGEARIREELAGNLCRCTGYRGIVRAIAEVAAAMPDAALGGLAPAPGLVAQDATSRPARLLPPPPAIDRLTPAPVMAGRTLNPAKAGPAPVAVMPGLAATPVTAGIDPIARGAGLDPRPVMGGPDPAAAPSPGATPRGVPGTVPDIAPAADLPNRISHTQPVALPLADAWAILSDPQRAAACLPGASLTRHEGEIVEGMLSVSLGPIAARLAGTGRLVLDHAAHAARLTGQGRDGANAARGEIAWRLEPAAPGCLLHLELAWRLTGPLAQFSRPALLRGLVRAIAADFAAHVARGTAVAPRVSALTLLRLWLRSLFSR